MLYNFWRCRKKQIKHEVYLDVSQSFQKSICREFKILKHPLFNEGKIIPLNSAKMLQ